MLYLTGCKAVFNFADLITKTKLRLYSSFFMSDKIHLVKMINNRSCVAYV